MPLGGIPNTPQNSEWHSSKVTCEIYAKRNKETIPWVPEDIFFWSIFCGEAALTRRKAPRRKKTTSGHRSTQPHFHARNQFRNWTGSPIGYSHVQLFDAANQGHCYIVNSLRIWEYPIGDPVQFQNWFLAWKWGWVLLWPEVIFFLLGALRLVNAASPRNIDQKKISSGTQGKETIEIPVKILLMSTCMNKSMVSQQILATVMIVSLLIRIQTTLNHIRFVLYRNIKDNERNLC